MYMDIISEGLLLHMGPRILFGGASLPAEPESTQFPWEPGSFYNYSCNVAGKESGKGNTERLCKSGEMDAVDFYLAK